MTGSLVPHSVIDAVEDGVREQVEVDDRRVMGAGACSHTGA
jgi:hypothetical protein